MEDKQDYVQYLEGQVEKISSIAIGSKGMLDRIDQLQNQLNVSEERILNLTRLVKLQQGYQESQEEEFKIFRDRFEIVCNNQQFQGNDYAMDRALESRVQQLESRLKSISDGQRFIGVPEANNERLLEIERKVLQDQQGIQAQLEKSIRDIGEMNKRIDIMWNSKQDNLGQSVYHHEYQMVQQNQDLKQVYQKLAEFDHLKRAINQESDTRRKEFYDLTEIAYNAENTCSRIAEDALARVQYCESQVSNIDKVLKQMLDQLKATSKEEIEERMVAIIEKNNDKVYNLVKRYLGEQENLAYQIERMENRINNDKIPTLKMPQKKFRSSSQSQDLQMQELENTPRDISLQQTLKELQNYVDQRMQVRSRSVPQKRSKSPHRRKSPKVQTPKSVKSPKDQSPKHTLKSIAMENSIKQKAMEQQRIMEEQQRKIQQVEARSAQPIQSQKRKRRARLEKLYQEMSAKSNL